SLAAGALPCSAQSAPVSQPAQDSAYLARMNEGYAAVAAGNQAAAFVAFDQAAVLAPREISPRTAAGYALLALKRNDQAIMRFQSALEIDENQDVIRRQLGYLFASGGRQRDALAAFTWLQTRDRASAQDLLAIGNLNAALGERALALKAFQSAESVATESGDSIVLRQSRSSMAVLQANGNATAPGAFIELYLSPFYQSRFENVVTYGLARAGVTAGGWWRPSVYASLRATRDSKSVGGQQPILYADNSIVPAIGIRTTPGGKWFTLYAEAGAAYPIISVSPRFWKRDVRAGVIGAFSNTRALGTSPRHLSLVSEVYGDVTWYDRFDRNLISYVQWRESLRLVQGRAGAVDVFARGWGAIDSRNTYYNRVVEGGGGVAFHLGANRRASLYIEQLGGHYLREPAATEPARNYRDFRVMFVTGLFHAFPFSAR
ncbi:MAG: hypothetical protein ABI120_25565, partial [Gemmatimonadaceae bacterium]